jgi:hypothetical protein
MQEIGSRIQGLGNVRALPAPLNLDRSVAEDRTTPKS